MISFLISIGVLVGGYFVYGLLVEKVFGIEVNRATPAITRGDGVDFVPMPTWKVFLIQFLNIAGLGPIFGAIMGIMFGPAAFLWIVLGTIFAGAVHDYISAMMSIRADGASLPEIVGRELGRGVMNAMRGFSILLLVLVGAVFVLTPADLLSTLTPDYMDRLFWIVVIFGYYILATLLPIDKLIGRFYPVFGAALLFMALGLLIYLLFGGVVIPDGFSDGLYSRHPQGNPIFPMMFVSIACGAISGFHATQSPLMARCLKNEKLARPVFYGAMVAEGLVALIWAAATIAFMGGYDKLAEYIGQGGTTGTVVHTISLEWLGVAGGLLAMMGVIFAPVTSGDTALRSARLIAADFLRMPQKKIWHRLALSLPLFVLVFVIMLIDFKVLWLYFAWANQTLAVFTLWAATVYLARKGKAYVITLLPAVFMTAVSVSYLLFAPRPEGIGLDWWISVGAGVVVALALLILFAVSLPKIRKRKVNLHSHTQFCDGRSTMEDMILAARAEGFTVWGFSPHAPIGIDSPCNMSEEDFEIYLAEVDKLRKKYPDIEIKAGVEADYLGESDGPMKFQGKGLDYIIGSVHFVANQEGVYYDIDGSPERFKQRLETVFGNDLDYVVKEFWKQTCDMMERGGLDIVGHIDKIAHNASTIRPLIEQESSYRQMVDKAIDLAIDKGLAVEINTKQLESAGRYYPHPRHWMKLVGAGVKMPVNSDAHHCDKTDAGFDDARKLMAAMKRLVETREEIAVCDDAVAVKRLDGSNLSRVLAHTPRQIYAESVSPEMTEIKGDFKLFYNFIK